MSAAIIKAKTIIDYMHAGEQLHINVTNRYDRQMVRDFLQG